MVYIIFILCLSFVLECRQTSLTSTNGVAPKDNGENCREALRGSADTTVVFVEESALT